MFARLESGIIQSSITLFALNLIKRELKLKKLIGVLVAALFAASQAVAQTPPPAGSGAGGGAGAGAAAGAAAGGLAIGTIAAVAVGLAVDSAQSSLKGRYRITLTPSVDPVPLNQWHDWLLRIESASFRVEDLREVTINGGMPEHGHGMNYKPTITLLGGSPVAL